MNVYNARGAFVGGRGGNQEDTKGTRYKNATEKLPKAEGVKSAG